MKSYIVTALFMLIAIIGSPSQAVSDDSVVVIFSEAEISIIIAWYRDHGTATYEGGGKKQKGLPPGIAKNLGRGNPLPPGIAKDYLPEGLLQALPPPPKGYERIIVDAKILLVEIASRVIHDILVDVILD